MQNTSFYGAILLLLGTTGLTGCGWVDSTGKQGTEKQSEPGIAVSTTQLESSIRVVSEESPASLLENTTSRVRVAGQQELAVPWEWSRVDEGNSDLCLIVDGFNADYAAPSLRQACTDPAQCELRIDAASEDSRSEFVVSMPTLKAPVALSYTLRSQLLDGTEIEQDQTICALSVNEAPTPGDDSYRIIAGVPREVNADDPDSLLRNDEDDIDDRNEALQVDPHVIIAPLYAQRLSLNTDGSFTYVPAVSLPFDDSGILTDSFTYNITDGLHDVKATARITLVRGNRAPQQIGSLPDIEIQLDDTLDYTTDLSPYFTDIDNDSLSYYKASDDAPDGLSIEVSDKGMLSFEVTADDPDSTIGQWQIDIGVTDGLDGVTSTVLLDVDSRSRLINRPPVATDISNLSIQNNFRYDVSRFFSDPDNDNLVFTTQTLPPSVQLSPEGVLSGRQTRNNLGVWFLVIQATDPFGESVSDGFRLIINKGLVKQ